jgi:voltage-gated potassium channel
MNVGSQPSTGLALFADAFWWTAYAMSTGAPSVPQSGEGRLLGWVLSLYGLAVFGYLTATLASHFIGRDSAPLGGSGQGLVSSERKNR